MAGILMEWHAIVDNEPTTVEVKEYEGKVLLILRSGSNKLTISMFPELADSIVSELTK